MGGRGAGMLTSVSPASTFLWTNNLTLPWLTPTYYQGVGHQGGSSYSLPNNSWLIDTGRGQFRAELSFWSSNTGTFGGCCHQNYPAAYDFGQWNRAYTLAVAYSQYTPGEHGGWVFIGCFERLRVGPVFVCLIF